MKLESISLSINKETYEPELRISLCVRLELFDDIAHMNIRDVKDILGDRFYEILLEAASIKN